MYELRLVSLHNIPSSQMLDFASLTSHRLIFSTRKALNSKFSYKFKVKVNEKVFVYYKNLFVGLAEMSAPQPLSRV